MQNKTPADCTKTARRGIFIFSCCCTGICTAAGALFASLSAQKATSRPPPAFPQNPRSFPPIRKLFFQRRPDDHGNHFAPCAKSRKTCSYKAGFPVPPPLCSGARSGGKAALTQPRRTGQNFLPLIMYARATRDGPAPPLPAAPPAPRPAAPWPLCANHGPCCPPSPSSR